MIRKTMFAFATVAAIAAAALIPTEASAGGGGKGGGMGGHHGHWGHGYGGGFGGIVVIGPSCWRWVPGLGRGLCLLLNRHRQFQYLQRPRSCDARPGPSICETCKRHAARLVPTESSARNTIETVFCLRRNHISASALNATSQQMTNGRRVLQSGP
jgi:hypothetical protein